MTAPDRDEALIGLIRERDRLRTIVTALAAGPEPTAYQASHVDYCPLCNGEASDTQGRPRHLPTCPWRQAVQLLSEHGARPR